MKCPLVQLRCADCEFPVATDGTCFRCLYYKTLKEKERLEKEIDKFELVAGNTYTYYDGDK